MLATKRILNLILVRMMKRKGKIDFEIPEILCVVNVDVGVNGVSVNELKLAVTENANEDITAERIC